MGGTGLKNLCAEGIGNSETAANLACGCGTKLTVNFMFPMLRTQLEASCATRVCVFAHDRPGLLYTISRAIFRLELSIELAKIATPLDQVLDAFYVTDRAGKKITDEARLESIQFELNNTLAEFDATGHQRFVG